MAKFPKTLSICITGYNPARVIPSKKAFLFSLEPVGNEFPKKLTVLSEKTYQAIRSDNSKGPCWGEDQDQLCFNGQEVTTGINVGGVFNISGIANPSKYFLLDSPSPADEVEVFTISGELEWHNGAQDIVLFHWIHSVDRFGAKLIKNLSVELYTFFGCGE